MLTFFEYFDDVAFFEGEFISVSGVVVIDGLAERQVGLGGRRRLLTASFGRRTSPAVE